jgi:hypothetical protein
VAFALIGAVALTISSFLSYLYRYRALFTQNPP